MSCIIPQVGRTCRPADDGKVVGRLRAAASVPMEPWRGVELVDESLLVSFTTYIDFQVRNGKITAREELAALPSQRPSKSMEDESCG